MEDKLDAIMERVGAAPTPQQLREQRKAGIADLDCELRTVLPLPRGWNQYVIDGRVRDGYGKEYSAADLYDLEIVTRDVDGRWQWVDREVEARALKPAFQLKHGSGYNR